MAQTELPLFRTDGGAVNNKKAFRVEITEVRDVTGDGCVDLADVKMLIKNGKNVLTELQGDGDFRSAECVELLKEADIVVTNPPFSLFREYVAQLVQYNKKFIIIGNQNAITYKEIFPLIKENKMWLGYGFKGGATHFYSIYEDKAAAGDHRSGMIRVSGVMWFTNLDHSKRHEKLTLYKKYNPSEYPHYDNYDAINVNKTAEIPVDYEGIMGVPITFLDKYCSEQFEIIGASDNGAVDDKYKLHHWKKHNEPYLLERKIYKRLFIQAKHPEKH